MVGVVGVAGSGRVDGVGVGGGVAFCTGCCRCVFVAIASALGSSALGGGVGFCRLYMVYSV